MLHFRQPGEADYRKRFNVLAAAGILSAPSKAQGTGLIIHDRETLESLSLSFFVAWCLRGVLADKVRFSFVPLPRGRRTLLVIHPARGGLAAPSPSSRVVGLDAEYLRCPIDDLVAPELPPKERQVLCPVLNKLRFNLGSHPRGVPYEIPRKSEQCCASRKEALWDYLDETLLGEPDGYGRMFGGAVVPLNVDPDVFEKYATGLEPDSGDYGKIVDETLLWFAMARARCHLGVPNFEFTTPFNSHEIDFALYETGGHTRPPSEPAGGWATLTKNQRLCVFETTVGHRSEGDDVGTPASSQVGNDHPKNKLLNFLALNQAGFQRHHFHYLSVTGLGKRLSEPTRMALKGTPGFEYWSLCDKFPEVDERLTNHLDDPVPVATFRAWHDALVGKVEQAAIAWSTP